MNVIAVDEEEDEEEEEEEEDEEGCPEEELSLDGDGDVEDLGGLLLEDEESVLPLPFF